MAPLFDEGAVAVVEWTVDAGWPPFEVPAWVERLLAYYGGERRLYAHGFGLSPLSGEWRPRQDAWLERLRAEVERRSYNHVSEHFCFSLAGDFEQAGPLPVPMTPSTVALGRARLERLAEIAGRPVGLENLATSFGPKDALDQGEFLDRLLEPVDGFVLLDVHNLYCQIENFSLDPATLLASYPLERVREIHVSGGSWYPTSVDPNGPPMRRDTHDAAVPEAVFALLELALDRCPNVEAVFLERLPDSIVSEADVVQFQSDYRRVVAEVQSA